MSRSLPLRRAGFSQADFDNEAVLYSPDDETVHCLNAAARIIWELCDGAHDVDQMAAALRAAFEVQAERDLRADVQRTLAAFAEKGLLAVAPAGSESA